MFAAADDHPRRATYEVRSLVSLPTSPEDTVDVQTFDAQAAGAAPSSRSSSCCPPAEAVQPILPALLTGATTLPLCLSTMMRAPGRLELDARHHLQGRRNPPQDGGK